MNTNNYIKFLKLLSIFHYIIGGTLVFLVLCPLIREILIIISPESFPIKSAADSIMDSIIASKIPGYNKLYRYISTLTNFILGEIFAIAIIKSGRFLRLHKKYWFSFVIACLLCLIVPFGTVVGTLTLISLSNKSVKKLYFSSK